VGFEYSFLHHGEATRSATGPAPKAVELRPCEFDSRPLRIMDAQSDLATEPGLNLGEPRPLQVRLLPHPLATTQLVEGA